MAQMRRVVASPYSVWCTIWSPHGQVASLPPEPALPPVLLPAVLLPLLLPPAPLCPASLAAVFTPLPPLLSPPRVAPALPACPPRVWVPPTPPSPAAGS